MNCGKVHKFEEKFIDFRNFKKEKETESKMIKGKTNQKKGKTGSRGKVLEPSPK